MQNVRQKVIQPTILCKINVYNDNNINTFIIQYIIKLSNKD